MPIGTPTVSVTINGLGTFATWTNTLDSAIARYLPDTTEHLIKIVNERTGLDFSDVRDKSALLVIIADYEGF
jgi:hypothetical protein